MNFPDAVYAQLRERTRSLLEAPDTQQSSAQLRALLQEWLTYNGEQPPQQPSPSSGRFDLLLQLIQLTPLSVSLVRLSDLRIVAVSKSFLDDFGYTRDEVIGAYAPDRILSGGQSAYESRLAEFKARGRLHGYPFVYRTRSGEERQGLAYSELLEIDGQDYAFTFVLPDGRSESQRMVEQHSARFRSLFNESPDTFMVITEGKIIECNRAALEFFGAESIDQLVGRSPGQLSPAYQPDGSDSVAQAHAVLDEVRISGSKRFEWLHQRLDGTTVWAEVVLTMIPYGADEAAFVSLRDVSDRVRTRQALQVSEERYRLAMEVAQEGIWDWDLQAQVLVGSPAYFTILGMTPNPGGRLDPLRDVWSRLHPDDRKTVIQNHISCVLENRDTFDLEYRMHHSDGSWRWIEGHGSVITRDADGIALRMVGTLRDVTGRKQDEVTLRRRTQEMEELFRISTTLSALTSVEEILAILSDLMHGSLQVDTVMVSLLDERGEYFVVKYADGILAPVVDAEMSATVGLNKRIMAYRQPVIIEDLQRQPGVMIDTAYSSRIGPAILAPLMAGATVLGALAIGRVRGAAQFDPGDVRLLGTLGAIAGTTLQRAKFSDQANQRLERLQALHQIDLAITTITDLSSTLKIVLHEAQQQLNADFADVLLLNLDDLQSLVLADSIGIRSTDATAWHQSIGEGLAGLVAAERRLVGVSRLADDERLVRRALVDVEEGVTYHGVPLLARGELIGVLEVFHRQEFTPSSEWLAFLDAISLEAAIAIDTTRLIHDLQQANSELVSAYDVTIAGWSRALDMRDKETDGHSQRVTDLTLELARRLGFSNEELVHVQRGALLHDIGKMGIPDRILLKPGMLDEEERAIMQRHPQLSYELLYPIVYLRPALDIPLYHHEKWDGTGYPHGMSGEDIPLAARIFAIVDVWDALTNDRPYRPAWSRQKALDHISEQSGRHFDPQVVEVFFALQQSETDMP